MKPKILYILYNHNQPNMRPKISDVSSNYSYESKP